LQSTKTFSQRNPFINNAKDKILFIGDGKFSLATAGLFSLYGWLSNNKQHLKTSSNLIEALLTTGILVQLLKRTFGRESPSVATLKRGRWDLFPSFSEYNKNQPRYYSFPSGHIATLTATVVVIANNYPDEKWIQPVGYTAIGLVGTSLVAKGWHWYSDLPLGIYLGYTIGNIIAPPENENPFVKNKVTRYSIFPLVYNNGVSLNYTLQF
jgi:membrane-associated phospholipid phosphatase